jgi:hypothetical protein
VIREQLSGVEYWECGYPWRPQHFIRVAFGEREFVAPCSDVSLEPWDHFPTLAEVVGEVSALVEMLESEGP